MENKFLQLRFPTTFLEICICVFVLFEMIVFVVDIVVFACYNAKSIV